MTLGVCHFKHTKLQVQVPDVALLSVYRPSDPPPPDSLLRDAGMMEAVGRWGPEPEKECVSACGCSVCPGVTRVRQVQLCLKSSEWVLKGQRVPFLLA